MEDPHGFAVGIFSLLWFCTVLFSKKIATFNLCKVIVSTNYSVMLSWNEILIRLALASLFGGLIGLERERKEWAAGLRTHMMVCVGSCLIMIVSAYGFFDVINHEKIDLDPSRIAAQVVSGIGFIGAGTIMFLKQGTIRGLTTAAGLWTVAAIGLATGGGLYFAASATTVVALIILWAILPFEQLYSKKFKQRSLRIVVDGRFNNAELLASIIKNVDLKVHSFNLERADDEYVLLFKFDSLLHDDNNVIISRLQILPGIKEISWTR